jgi:predicted nucleotidyltransferase
MARVRKPAPTLESIVFSTPEQKVLRLLLSEPTTSFTPRVISSKLKGVRGLGGTEGITRILGELQSLGMVDFVDNHRSVRLQDDNAFVQIMKTVAAISDLETLKKLLEPVSTKGVLFGSRATGKYRSDSDYDLFVVSETPEEIKKIGSRHPLQKSLELVVWTPEQFNDIQKENAPLAEKIGEGIVLWGSTW